MPSNVTFNLKGENQPRVLSTETNRLDTINVGNTLVMDNGASGIVTKKIYKLHTNGEVDIEVVVE
jgi:hypothetical protein